MSGTISPHEAVDHAQQVAPHVEPIGIVAQEVGIGSQTKSGGAKLGAQWAQSVGRALSYQHLCENSAQHAFVKERD